MKAKINKRMLLPKPYNKGFVWLTRYSEDSETDKMGRWARICYYNGFMICWVTGFVSDGKVVTGKKVGVCDLFFVHLLFPCSSNQGGYTEKFENLDDAKKYTESVFKDFKKLINN
jgi:hypothetical protein